TVLFVHGAAYPAHTSFDLKPDGMSWMDARLRRLSPRPSRLRPLHPSERDGQGARGQPADGARHGGVTTNVQCVGLERGLPDEKARVHHADQSDPVHRLLMICE